MDTGWFDSIAKVLATRQPRRAALSFLAALGLARPQEMDAKNKNEKKVRVCNCATGDAASCTTQKKAKDKAKKLLKRNPCAYKGNCTGVSGCAAGTVPPPPPACTPNCGTGCCSADACFADTVNADNGEPTAFGCCPAAQICRSGTPPFPDQCCYPDETCDPSLAVRQPELGTICCRPCGGACCAPQDECQGGTCTFANTARLPRTRRP